MSKKTQPGQTRQGVPDLGNALTRRDVAVKKRTAQMLCDHDWQCVGKEDVCINCGDRAPCDHPKEGKCA